jgi:cysteine desulfurase / selenocysteine lyase
MSFQPTLVLPAPAYDVLALREREFPVAQERIYLNHAGISPIPRRAHAAIQAINDLLLTDPMGAFYSFMKQYEQLRTTLQKQINAASPDEIVTVQSTSLAINLVAQAIQWQAGDTILLCDVEFPSNAYPWMRLAEQHGVVVKLLPAEQGGTTPEMIANAIAANPQTRLVAVSAIQFLSGHRSNLMAIGQLCHQHGLIFSVDAIQAAGHMNIDVQAMHIDILAAGGQKSLMNVPGLGFLYVRDGVANATKPTFVTSNNTVDYIWWLHYDLSFLPGAARFNTGTPNLHGTVSLLHSLLLLQELGLANVDSYTNALSDYLMDRLRRAGYPESAFVTPSENHSAIVTFKVAETDEATTKIISELEKRRIHVVKHWDNQKQAFLRVSFHCYNVVSEIDTFVNALAQIIAESK